MQDHVWVSDMQDIFLIHCQTPPFVCSFVDLVEREWLEGGHQFSMRHHPVTYAPEKEQAPIFLLFLDAVWQVRSVCDELRSED